MHQTHALHRCPAKGGASSRRTKAAQAPSLQTGRSLIRAAFGRQWFVILLLAAVVWTGCRSSSPTPYVAPRVTGRVRDARTDLPVKGVKVLRVNQGQPPKVLDEVRGGEVMASAPTVRTDADGRFELASQRSLSPFQRDGWYSVSLAFESPGYLRFTTNYSLKHSILSPKGEPQVNAGDIRLFPLEK